MSDYTPEPEMAQLFQRAQAGDRRSLNRLMRQHDGLVHHIIRQQWVGPPGSVSLPSSPRRGSETGD